MAYNNFPLGYQPMMYQPPQYAQTDNPIIWVQGEAGAKSYLVAPNKTVPLWDSESQTIYIKSADASGMPTMKIIDYTIRDNSTAQMPHLTDDTHYATHEELIELEKRINKQLDKIIPKEDDKHE